MNLKHWTIIELSDSSKYLIGIVEDKEYESKLIVEYIDINNKYMLCNTQSQQIKLEYTNHFKPTYINKELLNWSIENNDTIDDELLDIIDENADDDDALMVEMYHVEKDLIGKSLLGYRSLRDVTNKHHLLYTTPIVKVIYRGQSFEIFTESGSNYIVKFNELY